MLQSSVSVHCYENRLLCYLLFSLLFNKKDYRPETVQAAKSSFVIHGMKAFFLLTAGKIIYWYSSSADFASSPTYRVHCLCYDTFCAQDFAAQCFLVSSFFLYFLHFWRIVWLDCVFVPYLCFIFYFILGVFRVDLWKDLTEVIFLSLMCEATSTGREANSWIGLVELEDSIILPSIGLLDSIPEELQRHEGGPSGWKSKVMMSERRH